MTSSPRSSEADCVYWNTPILSLYRPAIVASTSKISESTPVKRISSVVFPSPSSVSNEEGQLRPLRKLKKNKSVIRLDTSSQIGEDTLRTMALLAERLKRNEENRDLLQGTRSRTVKKMPQKKGIPLVRPARSLHSTVPVSKPISKLISKPIKSPPPLSPSQHFPSPQSKGKSRVAAVLVPVSKEEEDYFDDDDAFEFALCSQLQVIEESISKSQELPPPAPISVVAPTKPLPKPLPKSIPAKNTILPSAKPIIKPLLPPSLKIQPKIIPKPTIKPLAKVIPAKILPKKMITKEQQAAIDDLTAGINMDDWSDEDF